MSVDLFANSGNARLWRFVAAVFLFAGCLAATDRVWVGNYEMDAMVEEAEFAAQMEQQYLRDLENATEVILDARQNVHAPGEPTHRIPLATSGGGSAGRAAAGALRIGNAVGAAFTDRRVLQPIEAKVVFGAGALLLALAVLFYFFPRLAVYPLIALVGWFGIALLYHSYKMRRHRTQAVRKSAGADDAFPH